MLFGPAHSEHVVSAWHMRKCQVDRAPIEVEQPARQAYTCMPFSHVTVGEIARDCRFTRGALVKLAPQYNEPLPQADIRLPKMVRLVLKSLFRATWAETSRWLCTVRMTRYLAVYLIFFAFNLIVSSFTKMPLPLYGSGFRHARISAANCLTTSLSTPSSRILVG